MVKIKKHINYLRKDCKGEFFFLCYTVRKTIYTYLSTTIMYIKATLTGINIGRKCRFNGITTFHRNQLSTIDIGNDCTFNSSQLTNFRGINHRCILQTGTEIAHISIGNNCGFSGTSIVCDNRIIIGNNVICGANTNIGDRDGHSDRYISDKIESSVIIGHNVWLGMNVSILKGVQIGENSIIAAGSIVTKNIPANVIAAGVPCKIVKRININKYE